MTYELAKQLKEAGFPQGDFQNRVRLGQIIWRDSQEEWFAVPILSELIAACGDRFIELGKNDDEWWTNYSVYDGTHDWYDPQSTGSTPEEAVARLWLALNSK
jgi:hypothetical protein